MVRADECYGLEEPRSARALWMAAHRGDTAFVKALVELAGPECHEDAFVYCELGKTRRSRSEARCSPCWSPASPCRVHTGRSSHSGRKQTRGFSLKFSDWWTIKTRDGWMENRYSAPPLNLSALRNR